MHYLACGLMTLPPPTFPRSMGHWLRCSDAPNSPERYVAGTSPLSFVYTCFPPGHIGKNLPLAPLLLCSMEEGSLPKVISPTYSIILAVLSVPSPFCSLHLAHCMNFFHFGHICSTGCYCGLFWISMYYIAITSTEHI